MLGGFDLFDLSFFIFVVFIALIISVEKGSLVKVCLLLKLDSPMKASRIPAPWT